MRGAHWLIIGIGLFVLATPFVAWRMLGEEVPEPPAAWANDDLSVNLDDDLALMWETAPPDWVTEDTKGSIPRASSDAAIRAASRVFNTVDLVGMARTEVIERLGDPRRSNDSMYNFAYWDAPLGSLIYRFDRGGYGWQFNVIFDEDAAFVTRVERLWIE